MSQREFDQRIKAYLKHPRDLARFVMIRADRLGTPAKHRYASAEERARGEAAKRRWFAYLRYVKAWRTLAAWEAILREGRSVMCVCDDPGDFDPDYAQLKLGESENGAFGKLG